MPPYAVAMCPWELQGFYAMNVPDSPKIYVDAGPFRVGVVFFDEGAWQQMSIPLPAYITNMPINRRQQSSEWFGVLVASQLSLELNIIQPTLVLDSVSAFGYVLKGSTTAKYSRARILMRLQTSVLRT